jgi:hypothetical protein
LITTTTNASTDSGVPLFCDQPDGVEDELTAFLELANAVAIDSMIIQHGLPPLTVYRHDCKSAKRKSILTVFIKKARQSEL